MRVLAAVAALRVVAAAVADPGALGLSKLVEGVAETVAELVPRGDVLGVKVPVVDFQLVSVVELGRYVDCAAIDVGDCDLRRRGNVVSRIFSASSCPHTYLRKSSRSCSWQWCTADVHWDCSLHTARLESRCQTLRQACERGPQRSRWDSQSMLRDP